MTIVYVGQPRFVLYYNGLHECSEIINDEYLAHNNDLTKPTGLFRCVTINKKVLLANGFTKFSDFCKLYNSRIDELYNSEKGIYYYIDNMIIQERFTFLKQKDILIYYRHNECGGKIVFSQAHSSYHGEKCKKCHNIYSWNDADKYINIPLLYLQANIGA